jgi:signal transduction histidine kinase
MTGGLLALARAERRGGEPRPVALVDFVNEWARQWQPLCDEYGIELALELAPVPAALADPDRLSQVIDNLVANALDASEGGTVIAIATRIGPDRTVEVGITDQGRGMSADERQRAFDRFWRAGPPGSAARLGGTGLGLPIAARLVAHDGGTIRLEAGQKDCGTVAVVSLPQA